MKYRCFRCDNFETIIKTHYIRHLKRKRPCPKVNDQEVGNLLEEIQNKSYINRFENSKISEKYTQVTTYVNPNVNIMSTSVNPNVNIMSTYVNPNVNIMSTSVNLKKYFCKHCQKKFKYRQSKSRHEKI